MSRPLLVLAAFLTSAPLALAQQQPMDHAGMTMVGNASDKANMEAMQKMDGDMPKQGTGDADRDFVAMMIPHHQGAVDMAKVELMYGKDPALKRLATQIVRSQDKELRFMKAWQAKHAK
jgi:uncharacterized protein (DUF305 family)